MRYIFKRYSFFIFTFSATLVITFVNKSIGIRSFALAGASFRQMLAVLPPIMFLLGLMDIWVPREKMMKYMGDNSGFIGICLAILIGSIAAGPMYAAFPFTTVLLRKGVRFSNIIIFMGAWCVTKVPTVMFELAALGYRFTFTRLLINLPGIIIMGYMVQWLLGEDELKELYLRAERQEEGA